MSRNTTITITAVATNPTANVNSSKQASSAKNNVTDSQHGTNQKILSCSSSSSSRLNSMPSSTGRSRRNSQLMASITGTSQARTPYSSSASISRSSTPSNSASASASASANSSRRSSVVLDPSAYRYSLNVGSISRFPVASGCDTSGADQVRAATRTSARINIPQLGNKEHDNATSANASRASISSSSSRASSRVSSRYMVEELAPQRRPVYLTLPSDPAALGPWSNTTKLGDQANSHSHSHSKSPTKTHNQNKNKNNGASRNSKIMTTFPFPHPVTPRRRIDKGAHSRSGQNATAISTRLAKINASWQRLLNAIFAGPYERQLLREEQQDDQITEAIIQEIAQRNTTHSQHQPPCHPSTTYGTLPLPPSKSTSTPSEQDNQDPYGYRQLAGPQLLPSYGTDLVARRRERRRARSRARFQCMALWTIWTVSILLVIIVIVLMFSFLFPDRLDIPSHHDEDDLYILDYPRHKLNISLLFLVSTFAHIR